MDDMMDNRDEKLCERPGCEEIFVRPSHVSRKAFAERRYCGRACADWVKKNNGGHKKAPQPVVIRGFTTRLNSEGMWRPNAPGWPDVPHIPTHLLTSA